MFLTVRTFLDGVRRAVSTPRRLIGLVFFIGYYLLLFVRPFERRSARSKADISKIVPIFDMPAIGLLDGIVFAAFSVLSIFMAMGVLSYRGGFKGSDVDVLFPTPVSPRVILVFRIVRDYMLTLLLPLLFLVIGYQPAKLGISAMIRRFPEHGEYAFRASSIAWVLMAMSWVTLSYAASLFVGRSDLQSDRNRKIIGWSIGLAIAFVAGYVTMAVRANPSWETAQQLSQAPVLRGLLFTATAATAMVMAPLSGNWGAGVAGGLGLVGIVILSVWVALTQVGWMYDQAAVKGFNNNIKQLQKSGDSFGIYAEYARVGKLKTGRVANWVAKMNFPGPLALVWKNMILLFRTTWVLYLLGAMFTATMTLLPLYAARSSANPKMMGAVMLGLLASGVFMIVMGASTNMFLELLRRVDTQKPFPFPATTTVFWEVASTALPAALIGMIIAVVGGILRPALWMHSVASFLLMPTMAVLLSAVTFLVTVQWPDFDDPTQRGFRGLMQLLGTAIFMLPALATFSALYGAFNVPVLVAAFPASVLMLACALLAAWLAGNLYASYNPSE